MRSRRECPGCERVYIARRRASSLVAPLSERCLHLLPLGQGGGVQRRLVRVGREPMYRASAHRGRHSSESCATKSHDRSESGATWDIGRPLTPALSQRERVQEGGLQTHPTRKHRSHSVLSGPAWPTALPTPGSHIQALDLERAGCRSQLTNSAPTNSCAVPPRTPALASPNSTIWPGDKT